MPFPKCTYLRPSDVVLSTISCDRLNREKKFRHRCGIVGQEDPAVFEALFLCPALLISGSFQTRPRYLHSFWILFCGLFPPFCTIQISWTTAMRVRNALSYELVVVFNTITCLNFMRREQMQMRQTGQHSLDSFEVVVAKFTTLSTDTLPTDRA